MDSVNQTAGPGPGTPRLLVYAGTDSAYFEEWSRRLAPAGGNWSALRMDGPGSWPAAPPAAVFVDMLAPPEGLESLLSRLQEEAPEAARILLTGLNSASGEIGGRPVLDSLHRKDWLRLQAALPWIRDRCEISERLHAARQRLEAAAEILPLPLLLLRQDGEILEANPAGLAWLEPDSGPGRRFADCLAPEDRASFSAFLEEAFRSGRSFGREFRATGAGGERRFEARAMPLPGAGKAQLLLRDTDPALPAPTRDLEILGRVLGAVPVTVTVLDKGGKMVYANPQAAQDMGFDSVEALLGTDPAEILRRFEILDAAGRPFPVDKLPNRLALQGLSPAAPALMQWRNRETREFRWSLVSASALKDPDGNVSGVVSTAQNITALKRAELELKESEERLRQLSEAAFEGIALIGDGRILEVNAAFGSMFGMPPAFFKDLPADRFFDPAFHPQLHRALSGSTEEALEGMARSPGGREFPVRIRGRRGQRQGRTFQVLAARNLAPERRLEEESARLFQLSPDLICILGYDGYFKRLSPSWEKVLGYTLEELYARPYSEFLHPDDVPPSTHAVEESNSGRHVSHFENRYRCKDGTYRWIQWNGCNLPASQQMLGIGRDITELRRQRRDLRDVQQRFQEQGRTMDMTLARILRALQVPQGADPALLDELEALVGFDGGLEPTAEDFDLAELLGEALDSAAARGELVLDARVPLRLNADPARLRFALQRMAGLWTQAARGRPWRLAVSELERDADQLWLDFRFECHPQGTDPIPPSTGDPELAGLLCAAWARKLGGRAHGHGDSLRLSLPFRLKPAAAAPQAGPRLLLVEDNPLNQRLMLELLELLGPFRVTLAGNGEEAVQAHAAQPFDLILMDYHLPGLNGVEAARRIRAGESAGDRRVPIIAITADALETSRRACLEAGMDDFLTKPILLGELTAALDRWRSRQGISTAAAPAP